MVVRASRYRTIRRSPPSHSPQRLRHSVTTLCLAAGLYLLGVQWHQWYPSSMESSPTPPDSLVFPALASAPRLNRAIAQDTQLVVDLSDHQVIVYRQRQAVASYPVAIGQVGWETPTGSFHVTDMRVNPNWQHPITGEVIQSGSDNPLGTRWIGFWSDGRLLVGFHGTNQPDLVGQAVSHGCLRMHNADINQLYTQIQPGTPVRVQP